MIWAKQSFMYFHCFEKYQLNYSHSYNSTVVCSRSIGLVPEIKQVYSFKYRGLAIIVADRLPYLILGCLIFALFKITKKN